MLSKNAKFLHQFLANRSADVTEIQFVINSSPSRENGHHLAGDICRSIFVKEKFCILIKFPLKFVSKGPIDSYPALI